MWKTTKFEARNRTPDNLRVSKGRKGVSKKSEFRERFGQRESDKEVNMMGKFKMIGTGLVVILLSENRRLGKEA